MPVGAFLFTCFVTIAVLEVSWKLNNDNTTAHPISIGPSLMLVEIFDAIPELDRAVSRVGYIIDLFSDSFSVYTGSGYFSFEEILDYKAFHAFYLEELSALTLAPHSIAASFCSLITVVLLPSGSTHIPVFSKLHEYVATLVRQIIMLKNQQLDPHLRLHHFLLNFLSSIQTQLNTTNSSLHLRFPPYNFHYISLAVEQILYG